MAQYRLSILDRYQGLTDTPVVPYFPQFDRLFPGIWTARVVTSRIARTTC